MPFPWKKNKGSRISRLADRFNTSKHGGSLVVQTGFPTSMIDLFHKNRDRLKKSAKKKRNSGSDSISYSNSDLQVVNPEMCSSNSEVESVNMDIELVKSDRCSTDRIEDDLVSDKERFYKVVEGSKGSIFIAVLKVLFMVVLASVTKRLVVGVSVSAFSLFLLEYVGNYVYGLSKSCSDHKRMLKVIVEKVLCFVRIRGGVDSICRDSVQDFKLNVQTLEIEVDLDDVIEPIICLDSDKGLEVERMELRSLLEREDEPKQEGSRRARLKTKMRKLVKKKLGNSRKKGPGLESVVPGFGSEVPVSMKRDTCIEKDGINELKQIDRHGKLSENEVDITQISSDPCELILSKEGSVGVAESARETMWISKYWVFCLIILSGLVGGRIFAIIFTLACCLILKPLGNKGDAHASLQSSGKIRV